MQPCLLIDIEGTQLTQEDREILVHPLVAGLVLFARNYSDPAQMRDLTAEIKKNAPNCMITVDQEGGRVQRFKEGCTHLSPLGDLGMIYNRSSNEAIKQAEYHATTMASECINLGVDMSFSPVLDCNRVESQVIGNRSFSPDPLIVTELGRRYISAMNRAGMKAVGKHFPGHGSVAPDSHKMLPVDTRSFSEILDIDMQPFIQLKDQLWAIMLAHIRFPEVDDQIVTFSRKWIQEILRKKIGFNGVIMSDDLLMAGAAEVGDVPTRARLSLEAGCDIILICNNRLEVIATLDELE